jgi:hypothetical protein
MTAAGPADATPASGHLQFFTTIIPRVVGGIRIVGSYAWATFNANGEVVGEEVFWPQLPQSLLADAIALRTKVSGDTGKKFLASLPADVASQTSEVVIRHTEHYAFSRTFEAIVELDMGEKRYTSALDGTVAALKEQPDWPAPAATPRQ